MNNYAILLAAGSGSRMESHDIAKCFIEISGKYLFEYSLDTFVNTNLFKQIVLVVPDYMQSKIENYYKNQNLINVISGGKTRQESVFKALTFLENNTDDLDNVLIHDAARPLVTSKIINDNIIALDNNLATMTAINSIDTIVKSDDNQCVETIYNRQTLRSEQTPAGFKYNVIYQAHKKALENHILDASDDCLLVKNMGHNIKLVQGDRFNFKVTNEIDLELFKFIKGN